MNGAARSRCGRFLLLLAPVVAVSAVLPAGRSDAAETVTAAEVVQGLKAIEVASLQVADYAGTDKAKAQAKAGEIEPAWSKIEDTVRANHKEAYAAFEKAIDSVLAGAKEGDAKKASGGAGALSSAVKFYAASFPAGFGSTASAAKEPAPAPKAGERTAAAQPEPAAAPAEKKAAAAPAAEPGNASLARTGPHDGILALAGAAFGLGGLALISGARRRA